MIASAATHGSLPLLPNDRAIERQLDVGLAAHERHFGRAARGIWLPECAYRPAGAWVSPADGHVEERRGLEDFLAPRLRRVSSSSRPTSSAVGRTSPAYGGVVETPEGGSTPYRLHAVRVEGGARVGVLARDPLSSQQVWSGKVGYPGDGRYLEFHKKRAPSGHRYWWVTDSRLDLGDKLPVRARRRSRPRSTPTRPTSSSSSRARRRFRAARARPSSRCSTSSSSATGGSKGWNSSRRCSRSSRSRTGVVPHTASEALAVTRPEGIRMPAWTLGPRRGFPGLVERPQRSRTGARSAATEQAIEAFEAKRDDGAAASLRGAREAGAAPAVERLAVPHRQRGVARLCGRARRRTRPRLLAAREDGGRRHASTPRSSTSSTTATGSSRPELEGR